MTVEEQLLVNTLSKECERLHKELQVAEKHIDHLKEGKNQLRTEIKDCLEALEMGKKFGVFLENEYESKKIVYKQCLDFIDQHMKGEPE